MSSKSDLIQIYSNIINEHSYVMDCTILIVVSKIYVFYFEHRCVYLVFNIYPKYIPYYIVIFVII